MRTMGWVVKTLGDSPEYWANEDSDLGSRAVARVFLTKMCAVAARDAQCYAACCRVYRLTRRKKK